MILFIDSIKDALLDEQLWRIRSQIDFNSPEPTERNVSWKAEYIKQYTRKIKQQTLRTIGTKNKWTRKQYDIEKVVKVQSCARRWLQQRRYRYALQRHKIATEILETERT